LITTIKLNEWTAYNRQRMVRARTDSPTNGSQFNYLLEQ